MDSINRNQPKENSADLTGPDAIDQTKTIVKTAQSCFFCTVVSTVVPAALGRCAFNKWTMPEISGF